MVKNVPANVGDARDAGLISGLGLSPGTILQYSHLGNPLGRGPWRATVCGVRMGHD